MIRSDPQSSPPNPQPAWGHRADKINRIDGRAMGALCLQWPVPIYGKKIHASSTESVRI